MERIKLNGMKLNDAIKELCIKSRNDESCRFTYECDNCVLSILTGSHYTTDDTRGKYIEVGIKDKDDKNFIKIAYPDEPIDEEYYDSDMSIMHYFPILGFPLLVATFAHLPSDEINDVFLAFSHIADNYGY